MAESQSSYRSIVKAMSLIGGVQVFQIAIQVIRSKFVAVLLGPAGMGIVGLLKSTTQLITAFTTFGIKTSAVKFIAEAVGIGDETRVATVIIVLRRLVWITGILGATVTLIFSNWLSQITFGNREYTFAFYWISVTLLFSQISNGQFAVLQGLRKLKYLAKASLYGSAIGLIIAIPLYYYFGVDGIVPVIIATSVVSLLLSYYFSNKVKVTSVKVTKAQTISEGNKMLKLGIVISISGLLTTGASYLIRVFISRQGGITDVGLYNAGFTIINTYVGLIFTAMWTDFYPRLSAVASNNKLSRQIINQQSIVTILILGPVLIVFLVFINWVVIILYSNKFIAVNPMIYWAVLGVFFKAINWAISTLFMAKGSNKVYLWNEIILNIYQFGLNIGGYYYWGLTGLGLSFLVGNFIYLIQVYLIAKVNFEYVFDNELKKIFFLQFFLALCSFLSVKFLKPPYPYVTGFLLILISAYYSFKELDKRLNILSIIKNIRNIK